jgi:hypothetical protein
MPDYVLPLIVLAGCVAGCWLAISVAVDALRRIATALEKIAGEKKPGA